LRFAAVAAGLALALSALGLAWEAARFGTSAEGASVRLESEVRRRFANRARDVESMARLVARDDARVTAAVESSDRIPALFALLDEIAAARPSNRPAASTTVWVPTAPVGSYRVLAWSDGPAEDVPVDRLAGPSALFVARGTAGLRLVFVQPVESRGRRVAVVAAETVLSPVTHVGAATPTYQFHTSLGQVQVVPPWEGAGALPAAPNTFVITSQADTPGSDAALIEVRYAPQTLADTRRAFRSRVFVVALVPLVVLVLFATGPMLDRRRRARGALSWIAWSVLAGAVIVAAGVAIGRLAIVVGAAAPWLRAVTALTGLALAALIPVSAWWRRWPRKIPDRAPVAFVVEQLLAGAAAVGALWVILRMLRDRINPTSIEKWQLPILPVERTAMVDLIALLLSQMALAWAVAGMVAVLAARWQLSWRHASGWLAAALWCAPAIVWIAVPSAVPVPPVPGAAGVLSALALFGLVSLALRHYYRHTTQAMRLVLLFLALLVPILVAYPLATHSAERASRALIEREYAPATAAANQPQAFMDVLEDAERDIDGIAGVENLLAIEPQNGAVSSLAAFLIWNQTILSRNRVTSEIEVYGRDRRLASRFALNVPEYESVYGTGAQAWQGTTCVWDAFAEVARFGAEERAMLHAERGLCDPQGRIIGAIVIHIVPDYRALPFVSSANPYYEVLGGADPLPVGSRVADLKVVVYGWSLRPVFVSERVAWAITDDVDQRISTSRDPFWTTLQADGRAYHVYFLNDRKGVYALGYAVPTGFQHVTRLSEVAAVVGIVFVLVLVGAALYDPIARRKAASLRVLFEEIRTSYYRKLFLFFVLSAVGPVLLFALAFGAYMTDRFRADVEFEAGSIVQVARRVFQELAAADPRSDRTEVVPTDDVMVWIRQVIDQDVNLFEGPALVATSQRDLFESGLLPTRTPAAVYRAIALNRLPGFVGEDQIGAFRYLVAAAPVSTSGRAQVLIVPLALRQRDIERQITELNRGVLVGAVVVVLFAAGLGASVAGRVSDPVSRLSRATRQIAAGRLDVRIAAETADELGRLVDDFNSMAETLGAQRTALARTHQLTAWAEMARQVAHEIKNPLTPIQLAAEHLQRVHEDQQRPLGPVFDQCLETILRQVRLLRQIASEFSNFAGQPISRPSEVAVPEIVESVVGPYRLGLGGRIAIDAAIQEPLPRVFVDRTLVARALTNLVENAVQAMPQGGTLRIRAVAAPPGDVRLTIQDTGVGMDAVAVERAFEPYFSTKTAGSGLGLANAKRNIEQSGGRIEISSAVGQGTTIIVTLPAAVPPGEGATSPARDR